MKHTDFYTICKNLRRIEQQELIKAVQAHGGVYEFAERDEDGEYVKDWEKCPVVMASTRYDDQCYDYLVVSVEVNYSPNTGNPYLVIYGIEKEYGSMSGEIEVATGHIEYIIDMIPETGTVKDVSSCFTPADLLRDVNNLQMDNLGLPE